ncbi:MAG: DUF4968 domain-containing protein, partial [Verrucomicrobia bacterium]|nr:DUF4968 domain-containing protein [Verrucomicrobiota bacterium]
VGNQYVYAEVCAPDVIRVACATNPAFFARKSLAAQPLRLAQTDWKLETNSDEAILTTPKLQARVALATGAVSFFDSRGHPVLEEAPHGRTLTPRLCRATRRFMGAFTRIPIQWDNASGTLTIGRRQGSFKGM